MTARYRNCTVVPDVSPCSVVFACTLGGAAGRTDARVDVTAGRAR